ncbi:MAG: NUDIX domain-containing protein, partial [Bacteroidota bacterium]
RKVRYFNFYYLKNKDGDFAVRQRPRNGFWGGLWEIPNEEVEQLSWTHQKSRPNAIYRGELKHVFTHFDMMIHVFEGNSQENEWAAPARMIPSEAIDDLAFSKAVLKIFVKIGLL